MAEDRIRAEAYRKWEAEGRPDGQAERHWLVAEKEITKTEGLPKARSSDQAGGIVPSDDPEDTGSDAVPSQKATTPFSPGELASENK
ncbi:MULTISPECIES: DUF2934 domain-containing protein [unclassified Rhizobium]|uniref:DUF2934 domain-containing protein n=1 Tax=unclassified Rhizobium TaxID=2613769 RepID=UPI001612FF84|nr:MULTISPECIES: DUF2934 domain-containing protein [unclassified Rhizobium]MBB3543904.1 hypothetical protein [Rhizobium sp. BK399]MCS4094127.1 hypothetical protein [Rhizobium sp. BK176]